MKKQIHTVEYLEYDHPSELEERDLQLLVKAGEALSGSYAPYSHYHVGAAVRMADGTVVTGSNQENMSFPAGLCAERVAVFAAAAGHPGVPVESLAITASSESFTVDEPVPPCGMCRQAIMEYEMKSGQPIRIILAGQTGKVFIFNGMRSLLPLAFEEKGLLK